MSRVVIYNHLPTRRARDDAGPEARAAQHNSMAGKHTERQKQYAQHEHFGGGSSSKNLASEHGRAVNLHNNAATAHRSGSSSAEEHSARANALSHKLGVS